MFECIQTVSDSSSFLKRFYFFFFYKGISMIIWSFANGENNRLSSKGVNILRMFSSVTLILEDYFDAYIFKKSTFEILKRKENVV